MFCGSSRLALPLTIVPPARLLVEQSVASQGLTTVDQCLRSGRLVSFAGTVS